MVCQPEESAPLIHAWGVQGQGEFPDDQVASARSQWKLRHECAVKALVCIFVAAAVISGYSVSGLFFGNLLQLLFGLDTSITLVERPLRCCSPGPIGKQICLPGGPSAVCCASKIALLCGAGSRCYLNAQGNPYCCALNSSGCANVCLDPFTRYQFVNRGGACNPVAPQGFNMDGTIVYVPAPWDANSMSYNLDGTGALVFSGPGIRLGTRDVTMQAKIIPHADGRVGEVASDGRIMPAVLYSRINYLEGTGFHVVFMTDDSGNSWAEVVFARNASVLFQSQPSMNTSGIQTTRVDLSGLWRASLPVKFRIIRRGGRLFVMINGVLANETRARVASQPIDVDSDLNEPLIINAQSAAPNQNARMDASVADLSITTSAAVCTDPVASRRDEVIRGGELCSPIFQPGLNADGTILHFDAPFDAQIMRFLLNSSQEYTFAGPPPRLGAGDFTMTVSATPVSVDPHGIMFSYSRLRTLQGFITGFRFLIAGNVACIWLYRDHPTPQTRPLPGAAVTDAVFCTRTSSWRANVTVSLRIIRMGLNMSCFVNGRLQDSSIQRGSQPIDVDSGLSEPLLVNSDSGQRLSFAVSSVLTADMGIWSSAIFP